MWEFKDRYLPAQLYCMVYQCNVATVNIDVDGMSDGQFAGLTHFSTEKYSSLDIKQENGTRHLVYVLNDKDSVGIKIIGKSVWFQSWWNYNGQNN